MAEVRRIVDLRDQVLLLSRLEETKSCDDEDNDEDVLSKLWRKIKDDSIRDKIWPLIAPLVVKGRSKEAVFVKNQIDELRKYSDAGSEVDNLCESLSDCCNDSNEVEGNIKSITYGCIRAIVCSIISERGGQHSSAHDNSDGNIESFHNPRTLCSVLADFISCYEINPCNILNKNPAYRDPENHLEIQGMLMQLKATRSLILSVCNLAPVFADMELATRQILYGCMAEIRHILNHDIFVAITKTLMERADQEPARTNDN